MYYYTSRQAPRLAIIAVVWKHYTFPTNYTIFKFNSKFNRNTLLSTSQ